MIPAFVGDQEFPGMQGPLDGYQYGAITASYMKPISRGSISIRSASTSDHPVLDPRWLTSVVDQQQAIAAFKRVRQIFESQIMVDNINIEPE